MIPSRWTVVILALSVITPAAASAQLLQGIPPSPIERMSGSTERIPEGFYLMPWLATGVVYDDNVLFTTRARRQDDVFLRVTPGLQASYQSTEFTATANYRFDSEVYSKLDELNSAQQRQFATVDLRGRPANNWTVNGTAGFAQTRTPFELNLLTSIQPSRIQTERYFINPSTEYRPDAVTRLQGSYGFSRDVFGGEVAINSHIFNIGGQRHVGAHDWIGPVYVGRYFTFEQTANPTIGFLGGSLASVNSHAFTMSWSHEFSADTRMDIRVGPRVTDGKLDDRPEALVGIHRRIPGGEVGFTYASALTTIISTVGTSRTDTILLRALYEPIRHFTVTVIPTLAWIKSDTFSATVYTAYVEAAYQFNKYVTAKASGYFSYQESEFVATTGLGTLIIPRNVAWFRLEFSYPARWE